MKIIKPIHEVTEILLKGQVAYVAYLEKIGLDPFKRPLQVSISKDKKTVIFKQD